MLQQPVFSIDAQVRQVFPEIKVGVGIIKDATVSLQSSALEALKAEVIEQVRGRLRGTSVKELPRVQAFRRIYKAFGVDPNSRRPSAEALLRRVLDPNKGLYTVNTVVDTYNLTSLEYQLPMAAYDLDAVAAPLVLRFARAGESHCGIGQAQAEEVAAGTLIYADQQRIVCREFNYRDADETKVTGQTKNLIVFVDGCAAIGQQELMEALETVTQRITQFNRGRIEHCSIYPLAQEHLQTLGESAT